MFWSWLELSRERLYECRDVCVGWWDILNVKLGEEDGNIYFFWFLIF